MQLSRSSLLEAPSCNARPGHTWRYDAAAGCALRPHNPGILRLRHVLQGFSHKGARPGHRLQAGHRLGQRNVGL